MKKVFSACFVCMYVFNLFSIQTNASSNLGEQNTMSVLWYQTAGEMRALYYQGYNLGKMRLLEAIRKKPKEQRMPFAIILDLDETVLDDSPYQAKAILSGKKDHKLWESWVQQANATALPGAIDFLTYAHGKGVDIYYVSNRIQSQMQATLQNLKRIGAPQAVEEHVLLRHPDETGKEVRRQQIAKTHTIVLLLGDNLNDFIGLDSQPVQKRNEVTDQFRDQFGEKFIIFPNPMNGDWEKALYHYNPKTDLEKEQIRKSYLRSFQP